MTETTTQHLTSDDLAKEFHRTTRTLEVWRAQHYGPKYFRVGRAVLYRRCDIDTWIESQIGADT